MIDEQKRRIRKTQIKLMIFNIIVALIFIGTCLCDIFKVFGTYESFYGELLYLGPLYLTCIVFNIALCKIQNSIKAIAFARLHNMMTCIHFFNLITYTILGTLSEILMLVRAQYDENGDHDEAIKNLQIGYYFFIVDLITNTFQLYLDAFVLYLILAFTKEKENRMEQT